MPPSNNAISDPNAIDPAKMSPLDLEVAVRQRIAKRGITDEAAIRDATNRVMTKLVPAWSSTDPQERAIAGVDPGVEAVVKQRRSQEMAAGGDGFGFARDFKAVMKTRGRPIDNLSDMQAARMWASVYAKPAAPMGEGRAVGIPGSGEINIGGRIMRPGDPGFPDAEQLGFLQRQQTGQYDPASQVARYPMPETGEQALTMLRDAATQPGTFGAIGRGMGQRLQGAQASAANVLGTLQGLSDSLGGAGGQIPANAYHLAASQIREDVAGQPQSAGTVLGGVVADSVPAGLAMLAPAGAAARAAIGSMVVGSAGDGISEYRQTMLAQGKKPNPADEALIGFGYGLTEYLFERVGIAKTGELVKSVAGNLIGAAKGGGLSSVGKAIAGMAQSVGVNMGEEAATQLAQNYIAKTYDPNRDESEGVAAAATGGGLQGALFAGVGGAGQAARMGLQSLSERREAANLERSAKKEAPRQPAIEQPQKAKTNPADQIAARMSIEAALKRAEADRRRENPEPPSELPQREFSKPSRPQQVQRPRPDLGSSKLGIPETPIVRGLRDWQAPQIPNEPDRIRPDRAEVEPPQAPITVRTPLRAGDVLVSQTGERLTVRGAGGEGRLSLTDGSGKTVLTTRKLLAEGGWWLGTQKATAEETPNADPRDTTQERDKALSKGKPVPPEVLADYPDLKPKAAPESGRVGPPPAEVANPPSKPKGEAAVDPNRLNLFERTMLGQEKSALSRKLSRDVTDVLDGKATKTAGGWTKDELLEPGVPNSANARRYVEVSGALDADAKATPKGATGKESLQAETTRPEKSPAPPAETPVVSQSNPKAEQQPWDLTADEQARADKLKERAMRGEADLPEDQAFRDDLQNRLEALVNATPQQAAKMSDKNWQRWRGAKRNGTPDQAMDIAAAALLRGDDIALAAIKNDIADKLIAEPNADATPSEREAFQKKQDDWNATLDAIEEAEKQHKAKRESPAPPAETPVVSQSNPKAEQQPWEMRPSQFRDWSYTQDFKAKRSAAESAEKLASDAVIKLEQEIGASSKGVSSVVTSLDGVSVKSFGIMQMAMAAREQAEFDAALSKMPKEFQERHAKAVYEYELAHARTRTFEGIDTAKEMLAEYPDLAAPAELETTKVPEAHKTTPVAAVVTPVAPVVPDSGRVKEPWEMTYSDLRRAVDPSTPEELQRARPLLAAMFPDEHPTDPWNIRRAIERGDEYPRLYFSDFSQKHRRHIQKALAEGKPVPPEVLADYPDLSVQVNKKVELGREPGGSTAQPESAKPKQPAFSALSSAASIRNVATRPGVQQPELLREWAEVVSKQTDHARVLSLLEELYIVARANHARAFGPEGLKQLLRAFPEWESAETATTSAESPEAPSKALKDLTDDEWNRIIEDHRKVSGPELRKVNPEFERYIEDNRFYDVIRKGEIGYQSARSDAMQPLALDLEAVRNYVRTGKLSKRGELLEGMAARWAELSNKINPDVKHNLAIVVQKVAPKILHAIEHGRFNDLMRPENKVSRALFTELTGVKLPKTLRDAQALFTGKPFQIVNPVTGPASSRVDSPDTIKSEPANEEPATAAEQDVGGDVSGSPEAGEPDAPRQSEPKRETEGSGTESRRPSERPVRKTDRGRDGLDGGVGDDDGGDASAGAGGSGPAQPGPKGSSGEGAGRGDRESSEQNDAPANSQNYIIDPAKLGQGGPKAKFDANIAAIKTLNRIVAEGRPATRDEQDVLAQYIGWGMFPQVFDYSNRDWESRRKELEAILSDEEFAAARRSTTNAHYTSAEIVTAMWDMVERMGFRGGRVLEPSMGSGNFFGLIPAKHRNARLTGVELDTTTGKIASLLYPDANIHVMGFQDYAAPDGFFDLAIGNVPFGDYRIADKRYNKYQANIHDYFFLKSIDKVRPGGMVVYITSTGTMDKTDGKIRAALAEKADLVSAIRLPGGAFEKNAGTAVVTDIIMLRKREDGQEASGPAWEKIASVPDPAGGAAIPVNEYFVQHPEQILGILDRTGTMYRGDSKNVTLTDDFRQRFFEAIGRLPTDGFRAGKTAERSSARAASEVSAKNGAYVLDGDKLYRRVGDKLEPVEVDSKTEQIIRNHMIVRDRLKNVFDSQLEGQSESAKTNARSLLASAYDGFVRAHGPLHKASNTRVFASDPDHPVLLAIENWNPETKKASKSDIFFKDTVRGFSKPTKADSPQEAVGITLNEHGFIQIDRVAELLGVEVSDAGRMIVDSGAAFLDPTGGYVTQEVYLSGNVKAKLADAIAAAKVDRGFNRNVEALEKVQPPDVSHEDIEVKLGAQWIPADDFKDFAAHLMQSDPSYFEVNLIPSTGDWVVNFTTSGAARLGRSQLSTEIWGTDRKDFADVFSAAMNGQMLRVYDKQADGSSVLNQDATAAANAKVADIKQAFADWIWSDDDRRIRLHRSYNDTFNNIRNIEYDGSVLTFPGMNPGIQLRPHQKNAVWLTITKGRALYAHEVGTGKTFTQIAAAMEMRRLGLAKKPAIVVLKSTIEQFVAAARLLYPTARILTTDDRFDAKSRKSTISQIATGDWDMVILTHDNLDMLPMRTANVQRFIQEELDELEAVLSEMRGKEKKGSRSVKAMEKAKERLLAKLKEAIEGGKGQDDAVTFEETGIDFLFVDEAHKYKTLPVYTKHERLKGIPTGRSDRATTMFMRTRWLMGQNKGRGVAFATGTPISNTVAELFTMMRYLQFDELASRGMRAFDAWSNVFTDQVSKMEAKADGSYQATTRLAKFVNLPELNQVVRQIMDVRLADDMPDVKRPKRKDNVVAAPRSADHAAFIADIQARAAKLKGGQVDPSVDNMLKISSDARKASLDLRLVDAGYEDYPDSKVNMAVEEILKTHRENPGKTQLVFSDIGVNKTAWGFSVFADIKKKLVAGGIPANKILLFTQEMTDAEKATAADKIKNGEALIGMGSTEKLGTGVNAQDLLIRLHHLDVPWLPAAVEQRDGRGWRQGNTNPTVYITRYVTQQTFDEFMWQLVDTKSKFIKQFMRNGVTDRVIKDEDGEEMTPAQVMAIASGDPRIMEKVTLEDEIRLLESARRRSEQERVRIKDNIAKTKMSIARSKELEAGLEQDLDRAKANKSDDGVTVTIDGKTYSDRDEAAKAFSAAYADARNDYYTTRTTKIGSFRGFSIEVRGKDALVVGDTEFGLPPMDFGAWLPSMINQLSPSRIEARLEGQKRNTAQKEKDLAALEAGSTKEFKGADELAKKKARLAEINVQLSPPPNTAGPNGQTGGPPGRGGPDSRPGYTTIFADILDLATKAVKAVAKVGKAEGAKAMRDVSKAAREFALDAGLHRDHWSKTAALARRVLNEVGENATDAQIDAIAEDLLAQAENPKTKTERQEVAGKERAKGEKRGEVKANTRSAKEARRIYRAAKMEGMKQAEGELRDLVEKIQDAQKNMLNFRLRAQREELTTLARDRARTLLELRREVVAIAKNLPTQIRGRFVNAAAETRTTNQLERVAQRAMRDVVAYQGREAWRQLVRVGKADNLKLLDPAMRDQARARIVGAKAAAKLLRSSKEDKYQVTVDSLKRAHDRIREAFEFVAAAVQAEKMANRLVARGRLQRADFQRQEMLAALLQRPDLKGINGADPEMTVGKRLLFANGLHFNRLMMWLDGDWSGQGPFHRVVKALIVSRRQHLHAKQRFSDRFSEIVTRHGYASLSEFLSKADGALGDASQETIGIKIGGREMTLGEAMYIYALDKETTDQTDKKVMFNYKVAREATPFRINKIVRQKIIAKLTPEQKAIVDESKALYDQSFWEGLDRVSKTLRGYHLEKVPGYWGIQRNLKKSETRDVPEGWQGSLRANLEESGILKERTGGGIPILIGSFGGEILRRSDGTAKIIAAAHPVRNAYMTILSPSVRAIIVRKFGKKMIQRIEDTLVEYAVGQREDGGLIRWLNGNASQAATQANPRSWARQIASVFTVAHKIGFDGVIRNIGAIFSRSLWREMTSQSPVLRERWSHGSYSLGTLADQFPQEVADMSSAQIAKASFRQLLDFAKKGTVFTAEGRQSGKQIDRPWRALKAKVKWGNYFDGMSALVAYSHYKKLAAKREDWSPERRQSWAIRKAEEAFQATANTNDVLHSDAYAQEGRKNAMKGMFLSFTSDIAQKRNMLAEGFGQGWRKGIRAAMTILLSALWSGAVTLGFGAGTAFVGGELLGNKAGMRMDKDYGKVGEKSLAQMTAELAALVPGGRFAAEVVNNYEYGGGLNAISSPALDVAVKLYKVGENIVKAANPPPSGRGIKPDDRMIRALDQALEAGQSATGSPTLPAYWIVRSVLKAAK